jgi:hypothetical protein
MERSARELCGEGAQERDRELSTAERKEMEEEREDWNWLNI